VDSEEQTVSDDDDFSSDDEEPEVKEASDGRAIPGSPWQDEVVFDPDLGVVYRKNVLILETEGDFDRLSGLGLNGTGEPEIVDVPRVFENDEPSRVVITPVRDDLDLPRTVTRLREQEVRAHLDHVLFSDQCACGCGCPPHPLFGSFSGNPFYANPFYANPFYANPFYANPFHANPFHANPFYANPFYANEFRAAGRNRTSALPSDRPGWGLAGFGTAAHTVRVAVLDTGIIDPGERLPAVPLRQLLRVANVTAVGVDRFDTSPADGYCDAAAGHGTFVAARIGAIAPGCDMEVQSVLGATGVGVEATVFQRLMEMATSGSPPHLVNMSFSTYAPERPFFLALAVKVLQTAGTVIVASAGNDATCVPTYPACLPGVIGVAAIGPLGPAPFTNYGQWVRACAPGVDVVSAYFNKNGALPNIGEGDPDDFKGWAKWSGTSFAAPAVVGALARDLQLNGGAPRDAVRRVIDNPELLRLRDLGTVVNVA